MDPVGGDEERKIERPHGRGRGRRDEEDGRKTGGRGGRKGGREEAAGKGGRDGEREGDASRPASEPTRHTPVSANSTLLDATQNQTAELISLNQTPSANRIIIMNSRLFLVLRSAARVPRTSAGRTVVRHLRPCFVLALCFFIYCREGFAEKREGLKALKKIQP